MPPFLWKFILVQSPPKIKSIRIVDNPFDDIVPRITAAEKRAQQRAKEQAQREREEEQRRKGAKKCVYSAINFLLDLNGNKHPFLQERQIAEFRGR